MINELLEKQPKIAEVREFENRLTTDPCVGLEERVKLRDEMQSLNVRWDSLYEQVTQRHDRYRKLKA